MKALIERVFAILPGAVLALTAAVLLLPGVLVTGDVMPVKPVAGPQAAKDKDTGDKDGDALRATGKQLEQCQACVDAIESARRAARELRAELQKPVPAWAQAAEHHQAVAREVRAMFAEQRKLEAALRPEQQPAFASDMEQFQRLQKSLAASLTAMEHQLTAEEPSRSRLQSEMRLMERAILEWKMRQETFAQRLSGPR
jgi:hypothetical protein